MSTRYPPTTTMARETAATSTASEFHVRNTRSSRKNQKSDEEPNATSMSTNFLGESKDNLRGPVTKRQRQTRFSGINTDQGPLPDKTGSTKQLIGKPVRTGGVPSDSNKLMQVKTGLFRRGSSSSTTSSDKGVVPDHSKKRRSSTKKSSDKKSARKLRNPLIDPKKFAEWKERQRSVSPDDDTDSDWKMSADGGNDSSSECSNSSFDNDQQKEQEKKCTFMSSKKKAVVTSVTAKLPSNLDADGKPMSLPKTWLGGTVKKHLYGMGNSETTRCNRTASQNTLLTKDSRISQKLQSKFGTNVIKNSLQEDSDSESDGWEAVEEKPGSDEEGPNFSNPGPVEITISLPTSAGKKEVDVQKYLLAQLRKREREFRIDLHEIHLMSCLSHGFYLNDTIGRNDSLLGLALSLWNSDTFKSKDVLKLDVMRLKSLTTHIKRIFPIKLVDNETRNTVAGLYQSLKSKIAPSYLHMCLIMLLMLRSLGLEVRLVYNMQPVPVKEAKLTKAPQNPLKDKSSPYFKKTKSEVKSENKKRGLKRKRTSSIEESERKTPPRQPPAKKITNKSTEKPNSLSEQLPSTSKSSEKSGLGPRKSRKSNSKLPARNFGIDYWIEVYCVKTKSYVPVHCISGEVNCYQECEKSASQPVHYVVAFGEEKQAKDVSALYSVNWLIANRKLQFDPVWWGKLLQRYKPPNEKRNEEEDLAIKEILLQRPKPKSVQEYKGHPLYILSRHLLKYEAIYPPQPMPVEEIKGEPVYLRDCVHLLHTRENWLKEAKVVKQGEKPYKLVKKIIQHKKPKHHNAEMLDLFKRDKSKPEMSELFGEWQTKDYDPPVAMNGAVPRNEYGNVDMFRPSMLPKGCVHIPIKNVHKVAKKLGIDCAAAMTGWDFSAGHCHPVMDGWIVCKEFEDTLMDAWNEQQCIIEQEEKEKKVKKVYDNWRKLLKGMLWKRKMQLKYRLDEV